MELAALRAAYVDHVRTLETLYARALEQSGFGAVVIHSGTPRKRTSYDDQYWPLRPTPEFQRWVPLAEPDCAIVVRPGRPTRLIWPPCTSIWERPAPPPVDFFLGVLDVERAPLTRDGLGLAGLRVAFIGDDRSRAADLGIDATDAHDPPVLSGALDHARSLKTPYEVRCLAEANRLAALGHNAVRKAFEGGARSELELHLEFLAATRQDDWETPYKNIVALGQNGAVLHHVAYGREAVRSESLLLDAGATYLGYCSDITRTFVRATSDSGKTFAGLVAAMDAMQRGLLDQIRTGMPYEALHDASHRGVSAILKESGLARGSVEEIDAAGVSRAFYPHGLGHSLGLQTHDVGCASVEPRADNPFLRNTTSITEHQTFTIEPGLYFIDGLLEELRAGPHGAMVDWAMVAALAPYGGIRIEDDVVVQASGIQNLTRDVLL